MIAITGASGLVGQCIVQKLIDHNQPICALSRHDRPSTDSIKWIQGDILDPTCLYSCFEQAHTVIHAAELVSSSSQKRKSLFQINRMGTRHVINVCLELGIPHLIFISSVATLGQKGPLIDETKITLPKDILTDYGLSKYEAEIEVMRAQEEGLRVSIVNPSVVLAKGFMHRSRGRLISYATTLPICYPNNASIPIVDGRDVAEIVYQLTLQNTKEKKWIAHATTLSYKELHTAISTHAKKRTPHIKLKGLGIYPAFRIYKRLVFFRRNLLSISPKMTPSSQTPITYDNRKSQEQLGLHYHTLQETLSWLFSPSQQKT